MNISKISFGSSYLLQCKNEKQVQKCYDLLGKENSIIKDGNKILYIPASEADEVFYIASKLASLNNPSSSKQYVENLNKYEGIIQNEIADRAICIDV